MADLSLQSNPQYFTDVPGRHDQAVGLYKLTMLSSADTIKVPELLTRSASADQSSARVLSPATGVTVTAGALDSNNEHTLTFAGSTAGSEVILLTVHRRGRFSNSVPKAI